MSKRIRLAAVIVIGAVIVLALLLMLSGLRFSKQQQVLLSDGRRFHIEAVTFGTRHVVGWNDWWLVPLRQGFALLRHSIFDPG